MIEYADYDSVTFEDMIKLERDRSTVWFVYSKRRTGRLGTVSLQPKTKKYTFAPDEGTWLDAGELDEIRSFLVTQSTFWMVRQIQKNQGEEHV
jgi:hypothetical protein